MRGFKSDEQLRLALSYIDRANPGYTPVQQLSRLTLLQLGELEHAQLVQHDGGSDGVLSRSYRLTKSGWRALTRLSASDETSDKD